MERERERGLNRVNKRKGEIERDFFDFSMRSEFGSHSSELTAQFLRRLMTNDQFDTKLYVNKNVYVQFSSDLKRIC